MKISIVMPNFNGEKYLSMAIDSFIKQEHSEKQLLIVDNKSTDSSHSIIEKYSNNYSNILWIKETDSGISNALNLSLKHIEEESIFGYLGSDDI